MKATPPILNFAKIPVGPVPRADRAVFALFARLRPSSPVFTRLPRLPRLPRLLVGARSAGGGAGRAQACPISRLLGCQFEPK